MRVHATDEYRRRGRVVTVQFSASVREARRRGALGVGPVALDLLQLALDGTPVTTLPFLPIRDPSGECLAKRPGECAGWSGGVCQIALRACTAPRLPQGKGWTPGYLPGGGRLAHPEVGEREGGNRWRRRAARSSHPSSADGGGSTKSDGIAPGAFVFSMAVHGGSLAGGRRVGIAWVPPQAGEGDYYPSDEEGEAAAEALARETRLRVENF